MRHNSVNERTKQVLIETMKQVELNLDRFNMANWIIRLDWEPTDGTRVKDVQTDGLHQCGTTMCLAGWIVAVHGQGMNPRMWISEAATELVGLTEKQADLLWYLRMWPRRYEDAYLSADSLEKSFSALKDRVEYFIQTGE